MPKTKKDAGTVFIRSKTTGHVHEVAPDLGRYLETQVDPVAGVMLYEKVDGPDGYSGHRREQDEFRVNEAWYGVPDDAAKTDAAAMAERGGQKKGTIAGPT